MPAVSKAQQRFMGMVHATQKGDMENPSPEVEKAADGMTKKDSKEFYFINTHLPHKDTNIIEIQNTLKGRLPEDIPIIIAGDLNDHSPRLDYWKGTLKINGKTLSANGQPPPTCCSTDLSHHPPSYGDYIISTNGKTTTNKPVPIIPGKITSDHLPVLGTVIL